jgi:hypothetical protein
MKMSRCVALRDPAAPHLPRPPARPPTASPASACAPSADAYAILLLEGPCPAGGLFMVWFVCVLVSLCPGPLPCPPLPALTGWVLWHRGRGLQLRRARRSGGLRAASKSSAARRPSGASRRPQPNLPHRNGGTKPRRPIRCARPPTCSSTCPPTLLGHPPSPTRDPERYGPERPTAARVALSGGGWSVLRKLTDRLAGCCRGGWMLLGCADVRGQSTGRRSRPWSGKWRAGRAGNLCSRLC